MLSMKIFTKPFGTTTALTNAPTPKTADSQLISQRVVAAFCDRWSTSAWSPAHPLRFATAGLSGRLKEAERPCENW